ncbi:MULTISPECIES: STAS domain-containing protein [unclassified Thioalkalivibrio]|uniref:STAS domain-containing protein n=1 Tax=unclassified Thioalkalivibrio TaxID=2621013 RepID=UPI00037A953C|nr:MULTISPECIES: STAS domain-containing protein [unclassified Thioalkalivibrio]
MTTIALPERLRIDTATACWQELRVALDAGEDLQVDATTVADIDAAGVQVLLMARHCAARHAQGFSIDGASAVLTQAFQALGADAAAARAGQEHDTDSGEHNG